MFVRLGLKSLPGTNTLAYYENSYIMDKKVYNIGPWGLCHKHFGLIIYGKWCNLVFTSVFFIVFHKHIIQDKRPSLLRKLQNMILYYFIVQACAIKTLIYGFRSKLMCLSKLVCLSKFVCLWFTIEKTLAYYKVWQHVVNYEPVMFYSTGPWGQWYKKFYFHNLIIFVISYSVCHCQAFPA